MDEPPIDWVSATFDCMGTTASIMIGASQAQGLLDMAQVRLAQLESRWSRFIDSSDVTRLNRAAGHPVAVSDDTIRLIERAVQGWWATDGDFDPTVLTQLVAAGYDRTFAEVLEDAGGGSGPEPVLVHGPSPGCAAIVIDPTTQMATLPTGAGFDPGGIGKGLAADLVCAEAIEDGAVGVCVELGGDVRVAGRPPMGQAWIVATPGIDHLDGDPEAGPIAVSLASGAVATSSVSVRRWNTPGGPTHHLLDPHRGTAVGPELHTVTVVAATGWQAEVLATAVFVRGPRAGLELVESLGAAARAFGPDGRQYASVGWDTFVLPLRQSFARPEGVEPI